MLPKRGRKKTETFNSEDFSKLSTEERRLRGKISTLRRMIKKRESDIEELMKPILKKRKEIKNIKNELSEITETFKNSNYNFPKFEIEEYDNKGNGYYRCRWYVNSKKKQKYLGSEKSVWDRVGITKDIPYKKRNEMILNYFLKDVQMKFWKDEYEDFKK